MEDLVLDETSLFFNEKRRKYGKLSVNSSVDSGDACFPAGGQASVGDVYLQNEEIHRACKPPAAWNRIHITYSNTIDYLKL